MKKLDEKDIDVLIEEALCGEKFLTPPPTLHSKVMKRVKIHQLQKREKIRFKYVVLGFSLTLLTVVMGVVFSISFYKWYVMYYYGSDAVRGYFDYYRTTFQSLWLAYQGSYSLILTLILTATTVALLFIPRARHPKM